LVELNNPTFETRIAIAISRAEFAVFIRTFFTNEEIFIPVISIFTSLTVIHVV